MTIASYLTSVIANILTYADLEIKIIAKYGKHHCQMMLEISELAEGKIKTAAAFFDWVALLKTQVVGITDDFL